jgi:hypothetical protein
MKPILQKLCIRVDPAPPVRLSTVPRARALECPRAVPWITAEHLTDRIREEKVTHVLRHAHWTDMV